MTCVVGLQHNGKVLIGADEVASSGWVTEAREDGKVFTLPVGLDRGVSMVIGFTDSYRMGQLLQYHLKLHWNPPVWDVHQWMCTEFIDAVRKCLKAGGWAKVELEREESGAFLVGWQGILWEVASDFSVARYADGYTSVGSGAESALGSLHSTGLLDVEPLDRVEMALNAAARFTASVRPPFTIVSGGDSRT